MIMKITSFITGGQCLLSAECLNINLVLFMNPRDICHIGKLGRDSGSVLYDGIPWCELGRKSGKWGWFHLFWNRKCPRKISEPWEQRWAERCPWFKCWKREGICEPSISLKSDPSALPPPCVWLHYANKTQNIFHPMNIYQLKKARDTWLLKLHDHKVNQRGQFRNGQLKWRAVRLERSNGKLPMEVSEGKAKIKC